MMGPLGWTGRARPTFRVPSPRPSCPASTEVDDLVAVAVVGRQRDRRSGLLALDDEVGRAAIEVEAGEQRADEAAVLLFVLARRGVLVGAQRHTEEAGLAAGAGRELDRQLGHDRSSSRWRADNAGAARLQ